MVRVLLAELPWLKPDGTPYKFAGREGMRWSYTSDKPPILSFRPFPFFLSYTSALLNKAGHEVRVIDALAYKIPYDGFITKIQMSNAEYLIAETHTPSHNNDKKIAADIKKVNPNIKIVFTGPHASAMPDEVLKEDAVDYVIIGEYEHLVLDLISGKITDTKITAKESPDIDSYPWPDRAMFPIEKYNETFCDNWPNVHILASRGCPFSCSYCNVSLMCGGRKIRYRNPHDVVEEMKYCIKQYEPKEFWFEDDNINANEQKFKRLMSTIYDAKIKVPFKAMGHMNISRNALELFQMAGGNGLKIGVESIDDEVLKRLKKGITFEMIKKTLQNCEELGIKTHLTYCIGLPGDTEETIKKTIEFAKKNGTQYQICMVTPLPGTLLFEEGKKEGWLKFDSWDDFNGLNNSIINYPNLSNKRIYELYQIGQDSTYKKIFLNGEWKKYLRMIYQERGIKGILKLFKRGDILKSLIKK